MELLWETFLLMNTTRIFSCEKFNSGTFWVGKMIVETTDRYFPDGTSIVSFPGFIFPWISNRHFREDLVHLRFSLQELFHWILGGENLIEDSFLAYVSGYIRYQENLLLQISN